MSGNIALIPKLTALDSLEAYSWVSLHTSYDPTGVLYELSDPFTYARQQLLWNPAFEDGTKSIVAPVTWIAPPASTIYWIGLWTEMVSGIFLGMAPAQSSTPAIFMCNDTTGGLIYCQGHNFIDGDQVFLLSGSGATHLPGGFSEAFPYFVYSTMTDYFCISASQFIPEFPDDWTGLIVPTEAGMGYVQRVVPAVLDGINDFTVLTIVLDSRLF